MIKGYIEELSINIDTKGQTIASGASYTSSARYMGDSVANSFYGRVMTYTSGELKVKMVEGDTEAGTFTDADPTHYLFMKRPLENGSSFAVTYTGQKPWTKAVISDVVGTIDLMFVKTGRELPIIKDYNNK